MERNLQARLAAFLDDVGSSRIDDGATGLETLLEDAALVALVLRPALEATGWLAACRALVKAGGGGAPTAPGVVARCRLAIVAAELASVERLTPAQLDAMQTSLSTVMEVIGADWDDRAAAIAYLVAGHVALHAVDTHGGRPEALRNAQEYFASAAEIHAGAFVDAFAKLRGAEVSLLAPAGLQAQTVNEAQDTLSKALETLANADAPSLRAAVQVDAEIRAGIGFTAYLLSRAGADAQALDLSIASLAYATRQPDGLSRGSLRWAKAMLTLASAWHALSMQYAGAAASSGGKLLDRFSAALDNERATLQEICDHTRVAAPEVWAYAHALLAAMETEHPGKPIERALERMDLAQGVFSQQACPETWSRLEANRAMIVLNHARLHRDQPGIDAGLRLLEHAAEIDDPMRDTLRNAYRRLGQTLLEEGRPDAAIDALERAVAAAEFVVARAYTAAAQRAEFGLLAAILKELATAHLKHVGVADAIPTLVRGLELDFAYGRLLAPDPQRSIDELERTARLLLGSTVREREWHFHLAFARTEAEVSAERLEAGRSLADVVEAATGGRRRWVDERLARVRPETLVPPGGALVLSLTTDAATFLVLTGGGDEVKVEAVPSPHASRSKLLEAVYGWGDRDGWLPAYSRSLTNPQQPTTFPQQPTTFVGLPAILESRGGALHLTLLPRAPQDAADMMPEKAWITALECSVRDAWPPFEPLHEFLAQRLEPGAPVLLTGEPLLSMLPLAGAWRHAAGVPREIVDDWSLGLAPSLAVLPDPSAAFRLGPDDAALVYIDQTGTLLFAEWEQMALLGARGGPKLQVLGGRRRATRAAVIDALGKSSVAHFACHARYEPSDPRESVIRLSDDDALSAAEITRLDLSRTKLVVLSACESGMINTQTADAGRYVGLATAFLEAGVERVIASLWSVNDVSTPLLMGEFYCGLADAPPIQALRNALIRTRDLTAIEVVAALRALVQRAGAIPSSALNRPRAGSLDALITGFEMVPRDARPFQSPYFWAGFVHYGAPT